MSDAVILAWIGLMNTVVTNVAPVVGALGAAFALWLGFRNNRGLVKNAEKTNAVEAKASASMGLAEGSNKVAAEATSLAKKAALESSMAKKQVAGVTNYLDTNAMVSGSWNEHKAKSDFGTLDGGMK